MQFTHDFLCDSIVKTASTNYDNFFFIPTSFQGQSEMTINSLMQAAKENEIRPLQYLFHYLYKCKCSCSIFHLILFRKYQDINDFGCNNTWHIGCFPEPTGVSKFHLTQNLLLFQENPPHIDCRKQSLGLS